jgi:hypothetical protein
MGNVHKVEYTLMIIYRSGLHGMGNILDRLCRENQSTRFVFNKLFPPESAVSEKMWKNIV